MSHRLHFLLVLGCAALSVAAASGSQTSNERREAGFAGSRVYAFPIGPGGITLDAGDADNVIVVRSDDLRNEFVITDQAGIKVDPSFPEYGPLCQQISRTKVRCALYEPGGVRMVLGNGDDSVRVESTHTGAIVVGSDYDKPGNDVIEISNPPDASASRIQGHGGHDTIIAGPSDDRLFGGPGDDLLRGSAGDDHLTGNGRADAHIGGPGDDLVRANQRDEDLDIRCGSGADSAKIDARLDPPPIGCEDVTASRR